MGMTLTGSLHSEPSKALQNMSTVKSMDRSTSLSQKAKSFPSNFARLRLQSISVSQSGVSSRVFAQEVPSNVRYTMSMSPV